MIINFKNVNREVGIKLYDYLKMNSCNPHQIDNDTNTLDIIVKNHNIVIYASGDIIEVDCFTLSNKSIKLSRNDLERIEIL